MERWETELIRSVRAWARRPPRRTAEAAIAALTAEHAATSHRPPRRLIPLLACAAALAVLLALLSGHRRSSPRPIRASAPTQVTFILPSGTVLLLELPPPREVT